MVQATCLYNGCLPCTDENNLVNQHQSGFLVQCSNHNSQTETDWYKPSSTDTSLPHWLQMLIIPPSQVILIRRCNENITFLLATLYKAVKYYTLNIYQTLYNIHPHLQELKTSSDIRKTISKGMWLEFAFPANTLQCISLNTAGGSCKALMTIIIVGDFSIS